MPAETHQVRLGGWLGGINLDTDPFQAKPDEITDGINFDVGIDGAISKRRGYSAYLDDGERADKYYRWQRQGGSLYHILVRSSGSIRYGTSTTLSEGPSIGAATNAETYYPTIATLNNRVYVSSLRNHNVKRFDGTSWSDMNRSSWLTDESTIDNRINSGSPRPTNRMPRCRVLLSAYGRFFAFNVILPDGTHMRSRLYYSGYEKDPAFDPELWPSTQWIDISKDDGQAITAAVPIGSNTIVVFKDRSIHVLVGRTRDSFYLDKISDRVGTTAGETALEVEGKLVFFDPYSGVWAWDGAVLSPIDDKIRRTLLSGINATYAWRSNAVYHQGKYYLSVPWGSSQIPNRTFVLDIRTGVWSIYDYGFKSGYSYQDQLYAVDVRGGNGVMRLNSGNTDAGDSYPFYIEFPWLIPEELGATARIHRVDFALSPTGAFDLDCALFSGWSDTPNVEKAVPVTSDGMVWGEHNWGEALWGHSTKQIQVALVGWGGYQRSYQFRLENNEANQPVQINHLALQVTGRRRNRGTR